MSETWRAAERTTTWLEGFDPSWLPGEVGDRVRIVVRRPGEVGLQIDGWVGSVTLANGQTLVIGSKFGSTDFMRILLRVQGVKDYAPDASMYAYTGSTTPIRYVVSGFAEALRAVHSSGQLFEWQQAPVVATTRPTFTDLRSTTLRMLRREQDPFVGERQFRTTDLPEHHVLSLAATFALADGNAGELSDSTRLILAAWKRRASPRRSIVADLRHVQAGLVIGRYSGARGYYVPALRLATVILGLNGLSVSGIMDTSASAFLTNSDLLFEMYVRAVLFDAYRDRGLTFEKESPDASHLFVDGTAPMQPDILVLRGVQVICLGDVKHKEPDSSDFYQIFTYLRLYGLQQGFLFKATENAAELPRRLVTRRDRVEVFVVPLPMGDLDLLEARLSKVDTEIGL